MPEANGWAWQTEAGLRIPGVGTERKERKEIHHDQERREARPEKVRGREHSHHAGQRVAFSKMAARLGPGQQR